MLRLGAAAAGLAPPKSSMLRAGCLCLLLLVSRRRGRPSLRTSAPHVAFGWAMASLLAHVCPRPPLLIAGEVAILVLIELVEELITIMFMLDLENW